MGSPESVFGASKCCLATAAARMDSAVKAGCRPPAGTGLTSRGVVTDTMERGARQFHALSQRGAERGVEYCDREAIGFIP